MGQFYIWAVSHALNFCKLVAYWKCFREAYIWKNTVTVRPFGILYETFLWLTLPNSPGLGPVSPSRAACCGLSELPCRLSPHSLHLQRLIPPPECKVSSTVCQANSSSLFLQILFRCYYLQKACRATLSMLNILSVSIPAHSATSNLRMSQ